ncbi:hypothetical protein Tco_1041287 [Tanacetum coccineum]|uniref:Reverse transcriptase Ty1/copia-type domain-containing protein n=1 Tax=Tanacetum coccineum TaxID=301880 RepID=A0ABQ5GI02_9ASTR
MIRVIHILNPTAYKEREEMEGQDEKEKKDREDREFVFVFNDEGLIPSLELDGCYGIKRCFRCCWSAYSQDKYVDEILKKFGFTKVKTASTIMETQKPLLKDENGKELDVHMYRSMIGSLMYLTSSRPDIMFAVCACARYQVNPKVSHLHAEKRIFSQEHFEGNTLDPWIPALEQGGETI